MSDDWPHPPRFSARPARRARRGAAELRTILDDAPWPPKRAQRPRDAEIEEQQNQQGEIEHDSDAHGQHLGIAPRPEDMQRRQRQNRDREHPMGDLPDFVRNPQPFAPNGQHDQQHGREHGEDAEPDGRGHRRSRQQHLPRGAGGGQDQRMNQHQQERDDRDLLVHQMQGIESRVAPVKTWRTRRCRLDRYRVAV